ncbi:MAG: tetratricopeptide repeat protein [Burkholderiales bacterium]|nr:tetratricopeptide repeat protein [Burkholderiales bacterium]
MPDPRLAAVQSRLAAGDAAGARALADDVLRDAALATPDRAAAFVLRARAHEAQGDPRQAIADLEGALALDPNQARVWNELGLVAADAGLADRAAAAFDHATRVDPGYARAWNNLANALRAAGRVADAARAAGRAVAADPGYALAWSNLGALARETGDDARAEAALRRALALDANQRGAVTTLAGLLRERGDLAGAAELFARAGTLDPRDANAMLQLGGTLAEADDLTSARAAFAEAGMRDPKLLRALFGQWLTLPMVPGSAAAVAAARAAFADGLARVEAEAPARAAALSADRLLDELRWTNFLLAYQGGDDKVLQAGFAGIAAGLVDARAPGWRRPLAARVRGGARVKIGFASAFFRDGTAGRYFEHWITALPREEFDVHVYHLLPGVDALAQRLAQRADTFRHCPWWRPSQVAPRIRADALDVLVYPELGMGTVTFALAALRLAPLQCAAWGHPVTTGHATVDVFLSVAAMEPADGAAHYTERLVTLPGIGTCYRAPEVPPDATRARFGLPDGAPLLLCPQSLFKIHPDNDALFARVLGAVPGALLVGFEGRDPQLTAKYRARLAAAGIAPERVRLLPQCGHDDYLRVNAVCDVMLDTLHWSGGNTSLDALACGLPLVTLPGRFMRGRQSAGMLGLMQIEECVARDEDDYVRIAAALAKDRARCDEVSRRILAAGARIFDDAAPVAALAQWLRENA